MVNAPLLLKMSNSVAKKPVKGGKRTRLAYNADRLSPARSTSSTLQKTGKLWQRGQESNLPQTVLSARYWF